LAHSQLGTPFNHLHSIYYPPAASESSLLHVTGVLMPIGYASLENLGTETSHHSQTADSGCLFDKFYGVGHIGTSTISGTSLF
jgi:hypothetical protein